MSIAHLEEENAALRKEVEALRRSVIAQAVAKEANNVEQFYFCVSCWTEEPLKNNGAPSGMMLRNGFCMNCGSSQIPFQLPAWAITSLQKQASYLGKRHWPHHEDKEILRELYDLRATIKVWPGRTYVLIDQAVGMRGPGYKKIYSATQLTPTGSSNVHFEANDEHEAHRKAIHNGWSLPYYSYERMVDLYGRDIPVYRVP